MISEETLARAGQLLVEAAHEPVKVILFGSHASGTPGADSDADFLVIERTVESHSGRARCRRPASSEARGSASNDALA